MKNWILLNLLLLTLGVGTALGYSGAGSIWCQPKGYFTQVSFDGDSTGFGRARTLCIARGGGIITLGPGTENIITTYPSNAGIVVIKQYTTGVNIDPFSSAIINNGVIARLGPSSSSGVGGAIRIIDGIIFPSTGAGIQSAINDLPITGGIVLIPSGRYLISSQITLKDSVEICGVGQGKTILQHNNSTLFRMFFASGKRKVIFRDMTIDGNISGVTTYTANRWDRPALAQFIDCVNVIIDNVEITNTRSPAIHGTRVIQFKLQNSWIHDTDNWGSVISGGADITYLNNHVENIYTHGLYVDAYSAGTSWYQTETGSRRIKMIGNTSINCRFDATYASSGIGFSAHESDSTGTQDVEIVGNVSKNNGSMGFSITTAERNDARDKGKVTISNNISEGHTTNSGIGCELIGINYTASNNIFKNNKYGITIQDARSIIVNNNQFITTIGSSQIGVILTPETASDQVDQLTVSNNTFYGGTGFQITNTATTVPHNDIIISNNQFRYCEFSALLQSPANRLIINSNIVNSDTIGVSDGRGFMVNGDDILIQNNYIKVPSGVTVRAIGFQAASGRVSIQGNQIVQAGKGIDFDTGCSEVQMGGNLLGSSVIIKIEDLQNCTTVRDEATNSWNYGTVAPTTGSWKLGQRVWNTSPASQSNTGWICTVSGSPGTWLEFGNNQTDTNAPTYESAIITNGVIARLGPSSSFGTDGAIRIIDGVTFPKTPAGVQAAIDDLPNRGGLVLVPADSIDFGTSTLLFTKKNVTLQGAGGRSTVFTYSGSGRFISLGVNDGNHSGAIEPYNGIATEIKIKGIRIIGPGKSSSATGITDWDSGSNDFEDIELTGFGTGYFGIGADVTYFKGCYIQDNTYGVYLASHSNQVQFNDCYFAQNRFGLVNEYAPNTRIIGGQFVFSDSADILIDYPTPASQGGDIIGNCGMAIFGTWFESSSSPTLPRHIWAGRTGTSSRLGDGLYISGAWFQSNNTTTFLEVDAFTKIIVSGMAYAGGTSIFTTVNSISGVFPIIEDFNNLFPSSVTRYSGAGVGFNQTIYKSDNTINPQTYTGSITPNALSGAVISATITGNTTINSPTEPIRGRLLTFLLLQDGTGGRTISWNSIFKTSWNDLANTANSRSSISFRYNGTDWLEIHYKGWSSSGGSESKFFSTIVSDSIRANLGIKTSRNITIDPSGNSLIFTGTGANIINASDAAGLVRLQSAGVTRLEANTVGLSTVGTITNTGKGIFTDSLRTNLGLYVGGQFINKILRASASLNFDLTAVTCQDLTITVTGAAISDEVILGVDNASITTDITYYAWVSATDTVTIRACDGALTGNPASGTFKVMVIK